MDWRCSELFIFCHRVFVIPTGPPLHLLGSDACSMAEAKIKSLQNDMTQWKTLSQSIDFAQ